MWISAKTMKLIEKQMESGGEFEGQNMSEIIRTLAERGIEKSDAVIDCISDRARLLNELNQSRVDALHDQIKENSDSLYEEIVGQRRIAELGVSNLANRFHDFERSFKYFTIAFGVLIGFCAISLAFILSHVCGI